MKISVIIPVHNGATVLARCLDGLRTAQPAPHEIIVVDDFSRDHPEETAQKFNVRIVQLPERAGPARARNEGGKIATGDVFFFVDADVVVHPDAIGQVMTAFNENPGVAAIFGAYDDTPAETNFLSQYKNLLHHYVHQTGKDEASTFWAGCGAMRRETFAQMGGFDEGWRHKIEDIELGYRLRRAGHRIRLVKTLQGQHLKRWTARSLLHADFFVRALPWTHLILREGRMINDLNLQTRSRVCVALSWLLPVALALTWWWAAGLVAVVLLALNVDLYRFFLRKRGFWFTLGVIPWHWFYYFYSGLAFGIGWCQHKVLAPAARADHPHAP